MANQYSPENLPRYILEKMSKIAAQKIRKSLVSPEYFNKWRPIEQASAGDTPEGSPEEWVMDFVRSTVHAANSKLVHSPLPLAGINFGQVYALISNIAEHEAVEGEGIRANLKIAYQNEQHAKAIRAAFYGGEVEITPGETGQVEGPEEEMKTYVLDADRRFSQDYIGQLRSIFLNQFAKSLMEDDRIEKMIEEWERKYEASKGSA